MREQVLALVAEKTGYPQDMLDLDLDLEADLGIDTVKQAELFATVREAYGIPRDDNLKLRDFPTLEHVIGFVVQRAGATPDAAPRPSGRGRARPVQEGAARARTARRLRWAWRPAIACPVACRCPCCGRPSIAVPLDRRRVERGQRVVVMSDRGGVGERARRAPPRPRRRDVRPSTEHRKPRRSPASSTAWPAAAPSRASTGFPPSTWSRPIERARPRRLERRPAASG